MAYASLSILQRLLYEPPVTYYFRACYSIIEFPTLLAKREIIANAFVFTTMSGSVPILIETFRCKDTANMVKNKIKSLKSPYSSFGIRQESDFWNTFP